MPKLNGKWVEVSGKRGIIFEVGPMEQRGSMKPLKDGYCAVHQVDEKGETKLRPDGKTDELVVSVSQVKFIDPPKSRVA